MIDLTVEAWAEGRAGATGVLVASAILKDHDTGRLLRVVLGRNVDPVLAHGAGEDLRGPGVLGHGPLRHALLGLRIGAELVVLCVEVGVGGGQRSKKEKELFHGAHFEKSREGIQLCFLF